MGHMLWNGLSTLKGPTTGFGAVGMGEEQLRTGVNSPAARRAGWVQLTVRGATSCSRCCGRALRDDAPLGDPIGWDRKHPDVLR